MSGSTPNVTHIHHILHAPPLTPVRSERGRSHVSFSEEYERLIGWCADDETVGAEVVGDDALHLPTMVRGSAPEAAGPRAAARAARRGRRPLSASSAASSDVSEAVSLLDGAGPSALDPDFVAWYESMVYPASPPAAAPASSSVERWCEPPPPPPPTAERRSRPLSASALLELQSHRPRSAGPADATAPHAGTLLRPRSAGPAANPPRPRSAGGAESASAHIAVHHHFHHHTTLRRTPSAPAVVTAQTTASKAAPDHPRPASATGGARPRVYEVPTGGKKVERRRSSDVADAVRSHAWAHMQQQFSREREVLERRAEASDSACRDAESQAAALSRSLQRSANECMELRGELSRTSVRAAEAAAEAEVLREKSAWYQPSDGWLERAPLADLKAAIEKHTALLRACQEAYERRRERALDEERRQAADRETCLICCDAAADTVLVPCGHLVTCEACAQRLDRCPIDRALVAKRMQIFRG